MSKTLIDIPDDLLAEAMELLGETTKAGAVRRALAESVRRRQTPAMRRARQLDVTYSDIPVELVTGKVDPGRAQDLIDAVRRDRDEDAWTRSTPTS
jgi:Arc/MetJ family transcription regulator